MGKYETLAKNTGFVFLGTIGSKMINFIMLPLYTKWLSPSEFGAVDTMNTYALFIVGFVCFSLPDSIFIFPRNVGFVKKSDYFSSGLFFSMFTLAGSAFFFYLATQFMLSNGYSNVFSLYSWLIYGLMTTTYLQIYFQSFTRSLDKMFHYSMAGIILTFSVAVFSLLLIPTYGLYGYAYALMAANIVAACYSFISTKSYLYLTIHNSSVSSVKEMLLFSIPLLPNGIMWYLVDGVNRPVMEKYLGLSAIGIYAIAQKFSGLLNSLLSILTLAWGNSVLDEYGKEGFDKFYNNYLKILASFLIIFAILICLFSKVLVSTFTTVEYSDASKYIPILMMGVILSGLSGTVGSVFSAVKKSKYFFYSSLFGGVASLLLLLILTPLYGLFGTVCSVAASFFCMFLARVFYAKKYVSISNLSYLFVLAFLYLIIIILEYNSVSNVRYVLYVISLLFIVYYSRKELLQIVRLVNSRFVKYK